MSRMIDHRERHLTSRVGWLRAAVLGANDGIVSTASLIIGVGATSAGRQAILIAGIAGLVSGAMSMAAGEYVSVSSQADTERADIARERAELRANPRLERDELSAIYVERGLSPELAGQVAEQLMAKDALAAHARDELGLSAAMAARPIQAASASAASFAFGAAMPVVIALVSPLAWIIPAVAIGALFFLCILGAVGANAGGASVRPAVIRVAFWGMLAMAITAGIGRLIGIAV